jgi:hypothetical protein
MEENYGQNWWKIQRVQILQYKSIKSSNIQIIYAKS